jgi:dephospho-CoA kinase
LRILGITGKYCAGKDAVTKLLVDAGYAEIDVDRIGHETLSERREEIISAFGRRVARENGTVDRAALGRIVFADRTALALLERIVHPVMVLAVIERIEELRAVRPELPGVAINAAVMFRMGLDASCDTVLYVHAPLCLRLRRARRRDSVSILAAIRRLRSQQDVDPQFSTSDAEICSVRNDGTAEHLRKQLQTFL